MPRISEYEIVKAAYGAGFRGRDLTIAGAVAIAESLRNTDAIGDGGNSFGLWQIHKPSHPELFSGNPNWRDPNVNARMAKSVRDGPRGWNAWTTYRTGLYLLWVPAVTGAVRTVETEGGAQRIGEAAQGVQETVETLSDPLGGVNDTLKGIVAFLREGRNWGRIGMIVVGGILVIVAAGIIARPVVQPIAKTVSRGML
jgi:Lysozyme like domain